MCKNRDTDDHTRARARNSFDKYCQYIAKNSRVGWYLNTPNDIHNGR